MDRIEALATAHNLTSREKEVFDLLLEDKSIAEIERELYISNGTFRAHIQHIYRKCGIHSRQELVELVDE
ncbi:MAG: helix-turn-helix transcriptional regulator [Eggerthellaceae bacterium]|nr:helix-turn-helix transcriptional regulator [Eggerthellaceae bacterium]